MLKMKNTINKKHIFFILLTIFILFTGFMNFHISSTIDANNGNNNLQSSTLLRKWTIMVYLDGDNNVEDIAFDEMRALEQIGSTPNVHICVLYDRAHYGEGEKYNWSNTRYFPYIIKDNDWYTSSWYIDMGELNMGDPATLEMFINMAKTQYPAERYGLVLFDHGAHEIFGDNLGGMCWDESNSYDFLRIDEIVGVLEANPVDILIMEACTMASATYYAELRDCCDVYVASENTMWGDNLPMHEVLKGLNANPLMNTEELGALCVEKYEEKYENTINYDCQFTLTAFRMSEYQNFFTALYQLSNQMIHKMDSELQNIINISRGASNGPDYRRQVDLKTFATWLNSSLSGESPFPLVRQYAEDLIDAINNMMIAEFHSFYSLKYRGVSLYFPQNSSFYGSHFGNYSFAQWSTWDAFLHAFYAGTNAYEALLDQFYNNNDFSISPILNSNKEYTNQFATPDQSDFYRAHSTIGKGFKFTLRSPHAVDFDLKFYNRTHSFRSPDSYQKTSNTIHVEFNDASVDFDLFYINVTSRFDFNTTYDFELHVPVEDDVYEENDVYENATDINTLLGTEITALKGLDGDPDWYNFTVDANDVINITLSYKDDRYYGYPILYLYYVDASKNCNYIGSFDDTGDILSIQYVNDNGVAAEYAICVENYRGTFPYTLTVDLDYSSDDSYEQDDDFQSANQITVLPITYTNLIAYDADCFNFTLSPGDWLNVTTRGTERDIALELWNLSAPTPIKLRQVNKIGPDETLIYYTAQGFNASLKIKPVGQRGCKYNLKVNFGSNLGFTDDVYEENDFDTTYDDLPLINLEENATGTAYDEDLFRFNVTSVTNLGVQLKFNNSYGFLNLSLLYENGSLIESSLTTITNEYVVENLAPGNYSVLIKYINSFGIEYNLSLYSNGAPAVDFSLRINGLSVTLEGSIISRWSTFSSIDWGDGSHEFWDPYGSNNVSTSYIPRTSALEGLSHSYNISGTYNVTIDVLEVDGDHWTTSRLIKVSIGTTSEFGVFGYPSILLIGFGILGTIIVIWRYQKRKID
ncbi:MAG: hypothetical protein EU549_03780 [Promethearchaeota archaeon]|nr:MAG: hypothetical protein EU549_03780 [Candidatus Lokiarchaeota archaeon]